MLTCYWPKQNRLLVQELVEAFSFNARRIARKLAHFVGVLNREDLNYHADSLREIAAKNRTIYRRLRKELEDLTNHGHYLMTRYSDVSNVGYCQGDSFKVPPKSLLKANLNYCK